MKKLVLSTFATALLAFAASFTAAPAFAEIEYPWCSRSSTGQGGGPTCRYATYEQCYAATVQNNGWCERNGRIVWQEQQGKRGMR